MKIGVFNTAFVGDVALMGQLIDALHAAGHDIFLISNAAGCSIFQCDPRVREVTKVKKERGLHKIASIFQIARQISDLKLDGLLVAHSSFTTGLCAAMSGVKRIYSFRGSALSHFSFEKVERLDGCHESRRYLELCRELVDKKSFDSAQLALEGDAALTRFSQAFPDFFSHEQFEFFMCSPGSVWQTKRYPPKLLARVVERLLTERSNLSCVVSGGPQDFGVIDDLFEAFDQSCPHHLTSGRIIDAKSCLPLTELVELTKMASFVITPDSAPLHVASATGTRTFALFGPTSAHTGFGPLAAGSRVVDYPLIVGSPLECQPCSSHGHQICPKRHHRCLADLPPDAVADYLLECLTVPNR